MIDALEGVLESEPEQILREVSVQELMEKLDAILATSHVVDQVRVQQLLSLMVLAENVWDSKDRLVLSMCYKLSVELLQRMRNYARGCAIREPIRVWVPVEKANA